MIAGMNGNTYPSLRVKSQGSIEPKLEGDITPVSSFGYSLGAGQHTRFSCLWSLLEVPVRADHFAFSIN
jgi:hypothetical protein